MGVHGAFGLNALDPIDYSVLYVIDALVKRPRPPISAVVEELEVLGRVAVAQP